MNYSLVRVGDTTEIFQERQFVFCSLVRVGDAAKTIQKRQFVTYGLVSVEESQRFPAAALRVACQGEQGSLQNSGVRGVTPIKTITFKTRVFVSSSRKKKQEDLRIKSIEEAKTPKIWQMCNFFPFRGWSVSKKDFLETSGQI